MEPRLSLRITNLRIDSRTKEIRDMQSELDKLKKAMERYGDKRLGKSYDDDYRSWGGPDPRMANGDRPNEKDYTARGSYIDINYFTEQTSEQFKDSGSISSYIKGITLSIRFTEEELEELISIRDSHLESLRETGFDLDGLDIDGYNKEGYDEEGYDREGYNKEGLNREGFNREGIHFETKTKYSPEGRDVDGYSKDGFRWYDDGTMLGVSVDRDGYDREGFQRVDKENYGFNREGRDRAGLSKDEVLEREKEYRKSVTPYYEVARKALVKWNGLTPNQAYETVLASSFEELESQVGAKQSMTYALEGLRSALAKRGIEISDEDFAICAKATFEPEEVQNPNIPGTRPFPEAFQSMRYMISDHKDKYAIIIETLSAIHDGWVKDNSKKFMARDKKYQHMPIELIGWDEVKSDLLFLEPILAYETTISEPSLTRAYYEKVDEFFASRNIRSYEDLQQAISQGSAFYPALEGQDDIIAALSDPQIVSSGIMQKLDSSVTQEIYLGPIRNGETITLDKINMMTSGVKTSDFQKATTTIKETVQEPAKENGDISLDD